MTRQHWITLGLALVAGLTGARAEAQVLFFEDFESVALGDSVNERRSLVPELVTATVGTPNTSPVPGVFSATGPAGWVVNNNLGTYLGSPTIGNTGVPGQGVADYGVDEWEGWTFVDKTFWSDAAGDQGRSQFASAANTVAVVDPDEYFDLGDPDDPVNGGYYNSGLKTPAIPVDGTFGFNLKFDSHWEAEAFDDDHPTAGSNLNNQAIEIIAVTNLGTSIPVVDWNSDSNDGNYKAIGYDENLSFDVLTSNPAVTSVELHFNMANGGNDWWWAIDNIEVGSFDGAFLPTILPYAEDFDGVSLGDSINEVNGFPIVTRDNNDTDSAPIPAVFSNVAPAGWTKDNTGTPALGNDNVGVFEWEGWSFSDKNFWAEAAGQGRGDFALGQGTVAIADGDEWDDLNDPDGGDTDNMETNITTPVIDVTGISNLVEISFDSSWRNEVPQEARVIAILDGNEIEVARFNSTDAFKANNFSERLTYYIDPAGASDLQVAFEYEGVNDYWWAIDNIQVSQIPEPTTLVLAGLAFAGLGLRRRS